jgi:sugar phosphate permease
VMHPQTLRNNNSERHIGPSPTARKTLRRGTTRIDTIETSNLGRYCRQAKVVICNTLYIFVTLGLCSMFFIVTGVQFWMTSYLIDILGNNPIKVVIIFSAVSITAPLAGVIVGGTFADRYGGYKGKNTVKAIKLCCAFGIVAFVFAFPLGFLTDIIYITVLLWTFLFFGAAIVPVGTGIMVSSVRKYFVIF